MPDANAQDRRFFQASWGRLDQIIEQFEDAWQSGQKPAIDAYLQVADVEPNKLLVELALADLECRLKSGEAARVEAYFERYAQLAADSPTALRLIAAEYDLRRRREPGLGLEEYLQRFPQYRADLPERLPGPHHRKPEPPSSSQRLGQFELLEAIGQGAFGTVYRARDTDLDRIVAVKVPRADRSITTVDVERLTREARSAAQLTHPGIVPVYEVGLDAALPYIVSAYVEGTTLADAQNVRRLDFRQAAQVMAQVAEALAHAHRLGVVHRDLKPSNIMLGRIQGAGIGSRESGVGERESRLPTPDSRLPTLETRAFVMDFGLARREEGEIRQTVEGQILGTPAYMSPEQARGQSHQVDGRSDLYSLGVILYELLTGELPFRGTARMVLQQILDDEPRPPRRLNDQVPRDLETIALKCMAKEPGRRYPSAAELAADLRRHLDGAPILARPIGRLERTRLWAKRNPRVAGLSAAVVALLATVALGATAAFFIINARKNAEMRARSQAEESAESARRHLDLTLDTLDKVVNEIQDQLRDQPALFELKRILLTKALAGLERVAKLTQDANTDPGMSSAHERLGDIFLQLGKAAEAREQYERFELIEERRAAAETRDGPTPRSRCVVSAKLGEACLRLNDLPAALEYSRQAVAMAKSLFEAKPQSALAARDLASCYNRLGAVQLQRGEIGSAADAFAGAVDMARKAVDGYPRSLEVKDILASAYENLGDARLQLGPVANARASYDQAMQLRTMLADAQPASARAKRALSVAYERLGDIALRSNDVPAAQLAYSNALTQCEKLAAAAPKNSLAHADVAFAFAKLGEASHSCGDIDTARGYFEKALDPLESLAVLYPSDARLQRDRAMVYKKLAQANRRLGELAQTRAFRDKALTRFERAAVDSPESVEAQADLAICCGDFGHAEMDACECAAAQPFLERSVAIFRNLERTGKLRDQPSHQALLRIRQEELDLCRDAQRAIEDLEYALKQPPKASIKLLGIRAVVFAHKGQHAEAVQIAERLRGLAPIDPDALGDVARCYSLCVPAQAGKSLTAKEAARRNEYTALAIQALQNAIQHGFKKVYQLRAFPDFAPIRATSDYPNLLRALEANAMPSTP